MNSGIITSYRSESIVIILHLSILCRLLCKLIVWLELQVGRAVVTHTYTVLHHPQLLQIVVIALVFFVILSEQFLAVIRVWNRLSLFIFLGLETEEIILLLPLIYELLVCLLLLLSIFQLVFKVTLHSILLSSLIFQQLLSCGIHIRLV